MARIERLKKSSRGKEIKCSKCGKTIEVGTEYLKATPYRRSPIIRCIECGLKSYETSGSEYIKSVGAIVENWQEDYGTSDGTAEEIASALEEIKETQEESLDNIPENLREGDTGCMLQERIDALEDVISELEQISFEDLKDETREEAESNVGEYDPDDSECGFDSEEEWENAVAEEMDSLVVDSYIEAIDEALSALEY